MSKIKYHAIIPFHITSVDPNIKLKYRNTFMKDLTAEQLLRRIVVIKNSFRATLNQCTKGV